MYSRVNPGVDTPLLSLTSSVVVLLSWPPMMRILPSSLLQLVWPYLLSLRLCVLVHWAVSVFRVWHSSWRREDGSILLIGGYFSETTTTTELVSDGSGVSTPGFTLKYGTKWVVLCLYDYLSLDKAGLEVKSSHYKQTYTWYPVDTDMAIITIITGMPAVSQTPPALSSLEEDIMIMMKDGS